MTVLKELSKYKLDLVGEQGMRWESGGTEPPGEYAFFNGRGMRIMNYVQIFLCTRESYQQLRGLSLLVTGCCHI
jgi:hypothetical protein